jgi:hypothetical protein
MKRFVSSALGVFLVAGMIGLMGCEGGGIEPGQGDPNAPNAVSAVDLNKMADMSNTPPPGTKPIQKGDPSKAAPAATPEKDAPKK